MADGRTTWSAGAHRYAEGAGGPPEDAAERARVDRFGAAVQAYGRGLPSLGDELDGRVMAAVRARPRPLPATWWRRLAEPRPVSIRPALAAAAAVTLILASSALTALLTRAPAGSAPAAATPPDGTTGSILVRFEVRATGAQRVALAGSFNDWSDSSIVFARGSAPDQWTVTVALTPGRYQYLFVVDGNAWIPDPLAHAQVEDEFGQMNSLLVVGPRGVVRS
ncbi:MAG TPA: glycogen-binding domain-containing protein [Gemmatimonadales bacterium]